MEAIEDVSTLQLARGPHCACSAWRETCTGSRFLGNTKLASTQSKGASVRCIARWWLGQMSTILCNASSPPRLSQCTWCASQRSRRYRDLGFHPQS